MSHFSSFLAKGWLNISKTSDFSFNALTVNFLESAARAPRVAHPTQATGKLRSKKKKLDGYNIPCISVLLLLTIPSETPAEQPEIILFV